MKSLIIALLLGTVALASSAGMASANEGDQSQKLRQELEVECETGAYGQNTKCRAWGKQEAEQKQKIVVRDRVLGKTHDVVNTALDAQSMIAVAGVVLTGAGSFALKRRIG
jgi:hypothetical protein